MNNLAVLAALFLSACASDFMQFSIKQNGQFKEFLIKEINGKYTTPQN